jgi:hypothetical protein
LGIASFTLMQANSIISNTISQDIRQNGHQSIRFAPDGFSVLVSDASYKPVFLQQYTFDSSVPAMLHPSECGRVLDEAGLLVFEGETVLIVDGLAVTLVPKQLFDESQGRSFLEKACSLHETDHVYHRYLKDRKLNLLYAVPEEIKELKNRLSGDVKIIHASECLVSLADQVQASDHQRGVVLAEVQPYTLDLLVIQEDQIRLLNRFALKDPSDFIYHTLNTLKQLNFDRETIPVYLSGIVHEDHELFGLLRKYVRFVKTTPYYLEELTRVQLIQFMILSEGSKCA